MTPPLACPCLMLRGLLALALFLAGCVPRGPVPSPAQVRNQCEIERTRRSPARLLAPELRVRPECRDFTPRP